VTLTIVDR